MRNEREFFVTGSHGVITVDAETGHVVTINFSRVHEGECDDCRFHNLARFGGFGIYESIVKFDLDEWCNEYRGEKLESISVDILDLAYWNDEGEYTEAAGDWRMEFGRSRQAPATTNSASNRAP